MSVVYSCVRSIDVVHVFVCKGHRYWSCTCVVVVSMMVMYSCAMGIDGGCVFVY
jgi:hypothetical protein